MNGNNKQLRSYSIRLEYYENILNQVSGKSYFNYNGNLLELNESIDRLLQDSVFEYAEDETGRIVSYSFHVLKLSEESISLYEALVSPYSSLFRNLSSVLGDAFTNFTCSVKFEDQSNLYYEFYFYPVFRNKLGKTKVKGISDKEEQMVLFDKLDQKMFHLADVYQGEYASFKDLCVELKGVSICIKDSAIEYCILIKSSNNRLYSFLKGKMTNDIKADSILFGIKIRDCKITGYTIYFKGEYGLPCCGWGEIIK